MNRLIVFLGLLAFAAAEVIVPEALPAEAREEVKPLQPLVIKDNQEPDPIDKTAKILLQVSDEIERCIEKCQKLADVQKKQAAAVNYGPQSVVAEPVADDQIVVKQQQPVLRPIVRPVSQAGPVGSVVGQDQVVETAQGQRPVNEVAALGIPNRRFSQVMEDLNRLETQIRDAIARATANRQYRILSRLRPLLTLTRVIRRNMEVLRSRMVAVATMATLERLANDAVEQFADVMLGVPLTEGVALAPQISLGQSGSVPVLVVQPVSSVAPPQVQADKLQDVVVVADVKN